MEKEPPAGLFPMMEEASSMEQLRTTPGQTFSRLFENGKSERHRTGSHRVPVKTENGVWRESTVMSHWVFSFKNDKHAENESENDMFISKQAYHIMLHFQIWCVFVCVWT